MPNSDDLLVMYLNYFTMGLIVRDYLILVPAEHYEDNKLSFLQVSDS